jgi:hypothetical protein
MRRTASDTDHSERRHHSVMERRTHSYEYKATEMNAPGTMNRFQLPNYGSRH